MGKSKFKKSTYLPIALAVYLGLMSYIGFPEYEQGNYFYYFGIIGVSLAVIISLHFILKRKEKLQREREDDINDK